MGPGGALFPTNGPAGWVPSPRRVKQTCWTRGNEGRGPRWDPCPGGATALPEDNTRDDTCTGKAIRGSIVLLVLVSFCVYFTWWDSGLRKYILQWVLGRMHACTPVSGDFVPSESVTPPPHTVN